MQEVIHLSATIPSKVSLSQYTRRRAAPSRFRSVFKQCLCLPPPDPGALNYCMHTPPETNDGFIRDLSGTYYGLLTMDLL